MISNCYDHYFQTSAQEFFGKRLDWLWLKAQGLAESGLNPEAVSPVGAIGVMQVMPGTAAEMARKHGIEGDPKTPETNIRLGTAYDLRCFNVWAAEEGLERLRFMFGSYNAGPGNIVAAQDLAGKKGLPTGSWQSIIATLPEITGKHAPETIAYVTRIEGYYRQLTEKKAAPSTTTRR